MSRKRSSSPMNDARMGCADGGAAVDFWCRHCAGSRLGKSPPGQSRGISGVVEQQAMRNGQQHHHNKRMRGRNNNSSNNNNRRNQNPLTRVYESNGPDVKIRGTANHVAEKYLQLARDSQSSGDPVSAENYFQHAEHYFRLIAAANEQFRQQNPNFQPQRPEGAGGNDQHFQQRSDEQFEEGGDEDGQPFGRAGVRHGRAAALHAAECAAFRAARQQQLSAARAAQTRSAAAASHACSSSSRSPAIEAGLPAFITGGAPQAAADRKARTATRMAAGSRTVSRCIAGAGAIAARVTTCRAARDGERPDDNG